MFIVDQVKSEFELRAINDNLSIWVTMYTPETTLRKFNDIKLNERRGTHYYYWNY